MLQRVAGAVTVARRSMDYVIVDLHPSYSPLNRALFDRADRILVPVTPDLPAIRARKFRVALDCVRGARARVRMRAWLKAGLRAWGIEVVEVGYPDSYEVRAFEAFTRGR